MTEEDEAGQGHERRREARYDYQGEVRYRKLFSPGISEDEHGFAAARVGDISNKGMLIVTDEDLPPGQRLDLFVSREGSFRNISGVVEVVRCTKLPLMPDYYSDYYNPSRFAEYEIALKSPGSKLFDHIREIVYP